MRIFNFLLMIGLLSACGSKKHAVVVVSQLHHSHCGGATPTEETIKGYDTPNNMDVIIAGNKDSMVLNIAGTRKVKLKKGVYHWYQGDKAKETSDLLESLEKELDTNYVIEGADCINEWKLNKDGAFTVSEKSDTIYLTLEYKCYTGTLPCVKYTGPKYQ